jgi:hypothetical protein
MRTIHTRSARFVALLAVLTLLAACGGSGLGNSFLASRGGLPKDVFVASYAYGYGDSGQGHGYFLSLFSLTDGRHVRDLVHLPEKSSLEISGFSRGSDGDIWYSLSRGPRYRSGVMNGDPAPGSCGGAVYRISHVKGKARLAFRIPADRSVFSPVPSPNNDAVAYITQPCTAAFAGSLAIRDTVTGSETHLAATDGSMHSPSWSVDGQRLVVSAYHSRVAENFGFAVIARTRTGTMPRSEFHPAPERGCVVQKAVFLASGIAVLEGCPDAVTAPARIVQLDVDARRKISRITTTLCPNGANITADSQGSKLLLDASEGCRSDVDLVQVWEQGRLRDIARYQHPTAWVNDAAW